MANYDDWKQKYSTLNDSQKQKRNETISWMDANSEARQFTERYNQEMNNNQQSDNNGSNFSNPNGTNWQNTQNFETPTINKSETQNNNNNNQTYNYDPNEKLDTSMFGASNGKVVVKEWTAQQTGMPDYQLDSDARMNEIVSNLNAYWQNNREFFQDRATYNKMFHYNERDDQQKALLDSYWKKKEDESVATKYNTADGIKNWMNDADITPDQLNYIKNYSPEAYLEWQKKQLDDINLRIANLATPADPTDNAELFSSLSKKLNLEPWDPYQIYDNWYNMAERLGVFSDSEKLKSYQNQLDANHSKMESIMARYANNTWWTVSDALAAARMSKALAPYQQRESDLQNAYTTLLNGRNSNLAIANQSAQALAMQAQEDQRIFNQRLQGLGFAMQTANYRTPEQQAQLQLQTAQIQNDLNLLNTARANDVNRYNQYATAKMQSQLQQELTDLSVEDETQLKANLNNALSDYYKNYGDIIQRSQAQAVDDIIAYAKKNWISVAQAMTENFIKPLQNKQEYKNKIASDYAAPTSASSVWYSKITINWKDYLVQGGRIIDPSSIGIGGGGETKAKPYNIVAPEIMESWVDAFMSNKKTDGTQKGGQCWNFVNDYLVSIGATDSASRYFWNEDINTRAKRCNTQTPTKWAVAVFNYNHLSDDWINHWHVAVVSQVNPDWSFEVVESNYPSWETIGTRHIEANDAACLWFINPSIWASATQWYNAKDPYSWVSGYTSWWIEINNGGWIDSLESLYWRKWANATEMKDVLSDYGLTQVEYNEQKERYMNYVETQEMVNSLLDVKARAEKLKKWAQDDSNNNLKWPMDLSIAEDWLWFWNNLFTTDATIESIQEWKALYDNLMSNAWFQKYLDMRQNWAQFWIMTDSEWKKVDNSVAPLRWEQKDTLFLNNLNDMIRGYDEVLEKLGYDFEEWAKPDNADQVEIKENVWTWDNMILTRIDENGKMRYSYDWWKTWK